ncbi:restriction endonuclease subunit S [Dolichospermum circinale]|uniref:restriction endonuclease subunit S n=1 Tax=Dolichospermum circinale TaxID=109265 RepID=UPI00232CBAFE|nr:restriction endonuclease subunit S [Dolichospermum circinale]MDB9452028.1 restriction endonuclease subunit S [Dolichospermum circinale CS-547]
MSNLPKSWNLLALNQICDLQNGYAFKSNDYVNISNTLNCRMSNIRPNGFFDLEHNQKFLPDSYTQKYQQYLLKDGDVIIAMTDMATEAKILGVPTIVETQGKNLLLNQRVGKLIIKKPELIYFPYLKYVLNREQVKKYFLKFAGGGLQINLGKDDILSVEIPLPPLEEQKRIAEILDQAEELRTKRRDAIAQLDTLTQSIFIEMFGDPVRNPKEWVKMPFGEVCVTRLGKMLDKQKQTGEYRRMYLRNANVQWFRFNLTDIFEMDFRASECEILRLQYGDLLICEGGEPGRAAIWRDEIPECYYQKTLHRARPKHDLANSEYLAYLLWLLSKGGGLNDHITSSTISHLTGEKLKVMKIPIPPIDIQQKFTHRIEAVESLKAAHRASLSELDALFDSLQHRAFKGDL